VSANATQPARADPVMTVAGGCSIIALVVGGILLSLAPPATVITGSALAGCVALALTLRPVLARVPRALSV